MNSCYWFKSVATEILHRLCMEMERFQRWKEHVGRFGFLLDINLLLRTMDEDTALKHSADCASFNDGMQSKQIFDDVIDTRVIFHYKEVPKYVLKKLATYGSDVSPNLTAAHIDHIGNIHCILRENLLETKAYKIFSAQHDGQR